MVDEAKTQLEPEPEAAHEAADEEAAALWAEFDKADEAEAAGEDPLAADPGDTPEPANPPANEPEPRDPASPAASGDAPSDPQAGQPSPTAAAAPAAAAKPGEAPAANEPTVDIWATATPEQRAAHEAAGRQIAGLEQYKRSHEGRLAAMQRQVSDLQAQLDERPAAEVSRETKAANGADTGKAATDANDAAEGYLGSEAWKTFAAEYPEVAGPIGTAIGELQRQNTKLSKTLDAIGAERTEEALDQQEALLATVHPDWQKVTKAELGFPQWLDAQPRHIREAADRNATTIVDAEEASDVIGRWKAFTAWQRDQQGKGGGQDPAARNGSQDPGGDGKPQPTPQLTGRRRLQLEGSRVPRGRSQPGRTAEIPDDPEAAWKYWDRVDAAEEAAANRGR